jgi:hypothetical protein
MFGFFLTARRQSEPSGGRGNQMSFMEVIAFAFAAGFSGAAGFLGCIGVVLAVIWWAFSDKRVQIRPDSGFPGTADGFLRRD